MWSFRFTLQHKREQAVDNEVSLLKTMAAQPKANNYVPSRLEDLRRGTEITLKCFVHLRLNSLCVGCSL